MVTPSSAPTGGAGRPAPRLPGPPGPGPFRPQPGFGPPPTPSRPSLTKAQQVRLTLVSSILVVLGVVLGLVATVVLPHVYAAQTTIRFSLGANDSGDDNADRTLTTQTVLITGRDVLQPVADSTGVPIDYLIKNTTATVVPNSEIIQIQVNHPDRASGIQLADAIAKRYLEIANDTGNQAQLQAQLDSAQRQLANPATPPDTVGDLQAQVGDLQNQIAAQATSSNIASIVAPAYSVTAPIFPDTLITLGIGALVGAAIAALVGSRMVRNWTRR
jgi:capsular polysaccharide biosynthesis protein